MSTIACQLWGDLIDPWSWIAKRRLEDAVAQSSRPAEVVVTFRAMPAPAVSAESLERAAIEGRPDGVDIAVSAPPDFATRDAHRLLRLALDLGGPALQSAVLERLYAAVFTEGRDLSSRAVLSHVAPEAGLDEGRVAALLASEDWAAILEDDTRAGTELGLTRSPALVVDQQVVISGIAGTRDYADLLDGDNAMGGP